MSSQLFSSKNLKENKCNGVYEDYEKLQNGTSHNDRYNNDAPLDYSVAIKQATPEYVKRTAQLFEKVSISNRAKTGTTPKSPPERSEMRCGNGEENERGRQEKKPSYLGVSCSNSGYRNVINYDSKLREGFRSSTHQRESLVLTNSTRFRDGSPFKWDYESKCNLTEEKTDRSGNLVEKVLEKTHANGVNRLGVTNGKFVNISTSTKTISTFRDCTDGEKRVNECSNGYGDDVKVSLNQILNKNDESGRKRYSDLGLSFKSPEKKCNSFLKNINSFENNCKKSEIVNYSSKRIAGYDIFESKSSIQQRIERLYGPAALAQGFYVQKPVRSDRTTEGQGRMDESILSRSIESTPQNVRVSIESIPDLLPAAPEVVLPIEQCSTCTDENRDEMKNDKQLAASTEKNGHYFLKLLRAEIEKLEHLASIAENELENGENLPEDISGKLRAASGKARLLVRQKLHQFEGLCQKNLNEKPDEPFPTTSEDLAGFWDMVMLQVVQVYGVFEEIEQLRRNNWSVTSPKAETNGAAKTQSNATKTNPKRVNPVQSGGNQKSEALKKAREENRKKMIEERRKKMKELKENKNINNDNEIEIFAK